jgi:hypothetical protein
MKISSKETSYENSFFLDITIWPIEGFRLEGLGD